MSAFTPGPWKAIRNEVWVKNRRICSHVNAGESLGMQGELDRSYANASLIAAAPDLLKALEDLYSICHGNVIATQMDQARAAIAAAKGEQ